MRKALMAEQKKMDAELKLKQLEKDRQELMASVEELKARCEALQKREEEKRASEEKKHQVWTCADNIVNPHGTLTCQKEYRWVSSYLDINPPSWRNYLI
jgi:hypothetical protein